jgi:hypothetical protein
MERAALVPILVAAVAGFAIGDAPTPLSPAEFQKLHEKLVPKKLEPWRTIPWRVDLLAAREEAIRSGRPLFLWAMNGHPLGCV